MTRRGQAPNSDAPYLGGTVGMVGKVALAEALDAVAEGC